MKYHENVATAKVKEKNLIMDIANDLKDWTGNEETETAKAVTH